MLVFADAKLVFLATPKTGTTAVETALRRHADLVFALGQKHVTARRYRRRIRPFLEKEIGPGLETVAMMRAPLDQLRSWYKYRARSGLVAPQKSTAGMTFEQFVADVLEPVPPAHAHIGSQFQFLTNARGRRVVDHLFAYEAQEQFQDFLSGRLGFEVDFDKRNVSPKRHASLSPQLEAALRQARAEEFALYARLWQAGGYLGPNGRKRRKAPLVDTQQAPAK
ncbi:hypothetical protein [Aliishimia ponticola]|uniref:hypothetical protein n=1 Tax=Aliishimia ponticola TaxID=2499833 RepID=UPI001B3BD1FD|nr:hypothetical protein [Aliishimia ponticola]